MNANINDPTSEYWGWKEPSGLTPLEQVPEVVRLEMLNACKQQQNDTITYLRLPIPSRDRLQQALDATKLWPPCLHSADPSAKVKLPSNEPWSEQEDRALLCIVRNCPDLKKDLIGRYFFMNRPETSADAHWPRLLKQRSKEWDESDDDVLLQLYEKEGEQFGKFATNDFKGKFTAHELEIAYSFA
jgi:hypothetical protein